MDDATPRLRVTGTRVDELRFHMVPPLRLAGRSVETREYVVLQVTLEDGTTGTAYVLTRGQPIGPATEILAQRIIGRTLADLFSPAGPTRGREPDQRARAVLDTCAWDLAGQTNQVPTWQLMSDQASHHQDVLLVAGYRRHGETDAAMARRLVDWRDEGYRSIKIAADVEGDRTAGLLAEIRGLVPTDDLELVLDLGFAGRDVEQLVETVRTWEPFGITWVEDPFPVAATVDIAALGAAVPMPVAAGDEAPPDELGRLLEQSAVDVLRADATTVGGLSGLLDITAHASVPVSLHIYPEIHRHVAFAMGADSPVETFPIGDEFDFVDRFINAEEITPTGGRLRPPEAPGLGLRYRPEAVAKHVTRSTSFGAV